MADKELGIIVTGDVTDALMGLEELSSAIQNLTDVNVDVSIDGLDEAAESADNLEKELDETTEAADKTGDEMTETGELSVEAMATAVLAVAGFTAAMETAADSINETQIQLGQLSTMTGMVEGDMADLIAHISNATFPTEEAMAYVKALHQAGVPNESLADSATALDRINDATGVGYQNVLKFINSMVAMGLNLSNIPQYYDVIAYANDNMVGGFQTYINWMMKYDSKFKEMGLTIDQTAVVIAAATKKFGGGRAAYQGVNKAITESNGNMRVFAQMLGLQPSQLANASTAVNAYSGQLDKLADEEAEHKTWLQEISAYLEDVTTRYGGILGPMASVAGAMGALSTPIIATNALWELQTKLVEFNTIANLKNRFAQIQNTIATKARGIAAWASATASAAYTFATSGEVIATIKSTFSKMAHTTWSWLQTAATYAVAAAQWVLNAAMAANPIGIVILAIVALVGILWYLYDTNEGVRNAINWVWDSLKGLGAYISGGFSNAGKGLSDFFNWFLNDILLLPIKLMYLPLEIFKSLSGSGDAAGNALAGIPAAIYNAFASIPQTLAKFAGDVAYGIGYAIGFIVKAPGRIYNALMVVPGQLYNLGVQIWNGLTGGLNAAYTTVVQAIYNIPNAFNNMITWLTELPGRLYESAVAAWNGFYTGLQNAYTQIKTAIWAIPNAIQEMIDWVTSIPDKMYKWGKSIIDSFVKGVKDAFKGVENFFNSLLGKATAGYKAASPPKTGPLQEIDVWGRKVGEEWIGGFDKVISDADLSTSLNAVQNIQSPTIVGGNEGVGVGNVSNTGGDTIFNINLGNVEINDNNTPESVGDGIADGFSKKLLKQANTGGVSVTNISRG
jgi:phage-related protein